jgi:hypothetical protein
MAIRKKVWVYPDANPSITIAFDSNAANTVSNSTTLDYLVVNFYQSVTTGNGYTYCNIPITSYTVQAGDYMEYDIYLPNNTPALGTDIQFSNGNLRDSGATDQNGITAHPSADLSSYAGGKWYHRKIPITSSTGGSTIGTSLTALNVVCEQDTLGTYTAYYKNYAITDGKGAGVYNRTNFMNFLGSVNGY